MRRRIAKMSFRGWGAIGAIPYGCARGGGALRQGASACYQTWARMSQVPLERAALLPRTQGAALRDPLPGARRADASRLLHRSRELCRAPRRGCSLCQALPLSRELQFSLRWATASARASCQPSSCLTLPWLGAAASLFCRPASLRRCRRRTALRVALKSPPPSAARIRMTNRR